MPSAWICTPSELLLRNISPQVAAKRATVGGLTKHHGPDHPAVADARRDLRAETLAEHIERTVAEWPPLTETQRARLAALLGGGDAA